MSRATKTSQPLLWRACTRKHARLPRLLGTVHGDASWHVDGWWDGFLQSREALPILQPTHSLVKAIAPSTSRKRGQRKKRIYPVGTASRNSCKRRRSKRRKTNSKNRSLSHIQHV